MNIKIVKETIKAKSKLHKETKELIINIFKYLNSNNLKSKDLIFLDEWDNKIDFSKMLNTFNYYISGVEIIDEEETEVMVTISNLYHENVEMFIPIKLFDEFDTKLIDKFYEVYK